MFKIDEDSLKKHGFLFPEEIEANDNILYHGTSNIFENEIEKHGLIGKQNYFSNDEIINLAKSLYKIAYLTDSIIGIQKYSTFDVTRVNGHPVFLHFNPSACAEYSMNAGGEKSILINQCSKDLQDLINDETKYSEYLKTNIQNRLGSIGFHAQKIGVKKDEIKIHSRDELSDIYNNHKQAWDKAIRQQNEYKYGIVYAIHIKDEIINYIKNDGFMGIMSHKAIMPELIIGKLIIKDRKLINLAGSKSSIFHTEKWMKSILLEKIRKHNY